MQHYEPRDYGYCPYCMSNPHKAGCPNAAPMPEKVSACELCGDPIYKGDDIIDVAGTKFHYDCFIEEYRCEA